MSTQSPLVLNAEQLACLSAPVKREIFEAMLRIGPASINELAAYLERSPKALYYHVRRFCAVGLMRLHETRPAGKRTEAVYALTADQFSLDETGNAAYRKTAARSVSALLRQVDREFRAASEAEKGTMNVSEVIRMVTRLRPETIAQLLEMLRATATFVRENEEEREGVRVALTLLVNTVTPPHERTPAPENE